MAWQALIFDVDGTLAETEELHRRAFNDAFAAAGRDWHWDVPLYARLLRVTGGKERLAHFEPSLDAQEIAALHRDKTARYTALVAAGALALRPGIAELIARAEHAGLPLAIATTTSRANVDALLAATLGRNPFAHIVAGDEVPRKKPAPDVYLRALALLGLPASACLAIEDTEQGLASARAAGLACLVTPSLYGAGGDFTQAWRITQDLSNERL